MSWFALPLLMLSLGGLGYTVHAGIAVGRFARALLPDGAPPEPVTLLKPLHGAEPRLADNIRTFLDQDWPAPIEMICGLQQRGDEALPIVRAIDKQNVLIVVDPTRHGANAKIDNLINMMAAASHDLLILSDSDIAAPRDYVRTVSAALDEPGVGAVSLLYRGRGDGGFWSLLVAGAISYGFVPAVVLGRELGKVEPCMGSTIALRRATLERIGGFCAFRDVLADDGAIGAAVQQLGLHIAMPRLIVDHGCVETSFAALWRHELRWAATIRHFDAKGYRGLLLAHPLPFALAALPLAPVAALVLLVLWLAARLWQAEQIDRLLGARSMPRAWLPIRDCLSFIVFIASFFVRSVDWRGARLRMEQDGRIVPEPESAPK